MAFLPVNEKEKKEEELNAAPGQAPMLSTGSAGSAFAGTGGSPAAGSGGSGPWTNIQAYLKANEGSTSTSDKVGQEVGKTLSDERLGLEKQVADVSSQNDKIMKETYVAKDQASKLLEEAGRNYNYKGNQSDSFNQPVERVRNYLGSDYEGPGNFAYGFGGKTQEAGQGVQSEEAFRGLVENVHQNGGKNPMSSGMLALQRQLDTQDPNLGKTRDALKGQYQSLYDYAFGSGDQKGAIASTDQTLRDSKNQFETGKVELGNDLTNQSGQDRQAIEKRALDYRNQQNQNLANRRTSIPWQEIWAGDPRLGEREGGYMLNEDTILPNGNPVGGYIHFTEPGTPDVTNVAGLDNERNRYNAIMAALGAEDRIGKADRMIEGPGSWRFDQDRYMGRV